MLFIGWLITPWGLWLSLLSKVFPIELWDSLSACAHPGIACLASWASDWLGAFWASLSGLQSSVTLVKLFVSGHSCDCLVGVLNYLASTSWLIDCALAQMYAQLHAVDLLCSVFIMSQASATVAMTTTPPVTAVWSGTWALLTTVTIAPSLMELPMTSGQHDMVLLPLRDSWGVVGLVSLPLSVSGSWSGSGICHDTV